MPEEPRLALRLIRGPVLENGTWHGIDKMVWEIEAAIDSLAVDTAILALEARQPAVAAEAADLVLMTPSARHLSSDDLDVDAAGALPTEVDISVLTTAYRPR